MIRRARRRSEPGRFARALAACCCAGAVLLGASSDRAARIEREQPPAAHTGGFGEPTCQSCHFAAPVNDGPGVLSVTGLPDAYAPGRAYALMVELTQPGMRAGGFQLAVRHEESGRQAGTVTIAASDSLRAGVTVQDGVAYAHHLGAGVVQTARDTIRWTVKWTAPAGDSPDGRGAVALHVVANAADDDASPLGDLIYQRVLSVRSPSQ